MDPTTATTPDAGPCCDDCARLVRDLNTPTPDCQGLTVGDELTVQWVQGVTLPAVVLGTCVFGALVQAHGPVRPFEMYVCRRNDLGNWHR